MNPQTFEPTPVNGIPPPGFSVSLPDRIPEPVFDSQKSTNDVLNRRSQLEQQQALMNTTQSVLGSVQNFLSGAVNPFTDPQAFLMSSFNQPLSAAATQQQGLLNNVADTTSNFYGDRTQQIQNAYQNAGVNDANQALSDIQTQAADRRVQLRQDLRNMQTDPNARNVARGFYEDNQNKVTADANAELADLAIQEIAASGRYDRALDVAKTEIQDQLNAFEGQIAQQMAQLKALEPVLQGEQKNQLFQQQIALGQLSLKAEQDAQDALAVRQYAFEAARNGAPQSLIQQAIKSGSSEEALALISPYIGKLDRQAAAISLMNARTSAAKTTEPGGLGINTDFTFEEYLQAKGIDPKTIGKESISAYKGEYDTLKNGATAIDRATARLALKAPSNQKETNFKQLLLDNVSSGNLEVAAQDIVSTAYNWANATERDVIDGKRKSVEALLRIQNLLDEYPGDTNIFVGKTEEQLRNLGSTLDPDLARIGTAISLAIIEYRAAVSGAAFTESEARAYEALFPSVSNQKTLNDATISELIEQFGDHVDTWYSSQLGAEEYKAISQLLDDEPPASKSVQQNPQPVNSNDPLNIMGE